MIPPRGVYLTALDSRFDATRSMATGSTLASSDGRESLVDDRHGLGRAAHAGQGLALQPLRGGHAQGRIARFGAGEREGLRGQAERCLGIAHHRRFGPGDGRVEG